ncbi:Arabinogalactan peptide 16 [Zea mays]|uniref:Arabinogalactan peptide 16 n=1 Tax=Zea mays TaxID=4577 RepID=A0A3L6DRD5_MAIZE|nr:Arabinogalactan peptide 16 [Zea mays]
MIRRWNICAARQIEMTAKAKATEPARSSLNQDGIPDWPILPQTANSPPQRLCMCVGPPPAQHAIAVPARGGGVNAHAVQAELIGIPRLWSVCAPPAAAAAMAMGSLAFATALVFVFAIAVPAAAAAAQAPAPAPTSDGTSIDQGIAYLLMIMALVLTYLIHPLDASAPYKLF